MLTKLVSNLLFVEIKVKSLYDVSGRCIFFSFLADTVTNNSNNEAGNYETIDKMEIESAPIESNESFPVEATTYTNLTQIKVACKSKYQLI